MLEPIWERDRGAAPEISVLMPVYRTPEFVGDAIGSVLDQTGNVLEVLISDDSSGDATLERALAVAQSYDGPHAIRVFRTRRRLAIDHLGALVAEARAGFMVEAHGDDLSLPGRMAALHTAHRQSGAALVTSEAELTEDEAAPGDILPGLQPDSAVLMRRQGVFQGARYGFHRVIYDAFPPLTGAYLPRGHDVVQAFRAQLTGGVHVLGERLLTRRQHAGQWSRSGRSWDARMPPARRFGHALNRLGIVAVMRSDLDHLEATRGPHERAASLRGLIDAEERAMLGVLVGARRELRAHGFEPQWRSLDAIERGNQSTLRWPPSDEPRPPAPPPPLARRSLNRLLRLIGRS